MIWFVLPIVVGAVVLVKAYLSWDFLGEAIFAGIMSTLISGMVVIFAGIIFDSLWATDDYEVESHSFDIIAVADDSLVSGRVFLFGGSIDEEPQYFFYRQYDDGAIVQGNIPTEKSRVYERPVDYGEVKVIGTGCRDWSLFAVGNGGPFAERGSVDNCYKTRYEISVPENTVARDFTLDLGK